MLDERRGRMCSDSFKRPGYRKARNEVVAKSGGKYREYCFQRNLRMFIG